MSGRSPTTPLIIETSRGPCIAGTRITIYAIMDYLKSGLSHDLIKQNFLLSDEQLHAVLQYLAAHREELEHHYAEIMRRSEERRTHYEQLYRTRTKFPSHMSSAEKAALMRLELAQKQQDAQPEHASDRSLRSIHPSQ
jgi:uncharacterized protein (DUF433 family)